MCAEVPGNTKVHNTFQELLQMLTTRDLYRIYIVTYLPTFGSNRLQLSKEHLRLLPKLINRRVFKHYTFDRESYIRLFQHLTQPINITGAITTDISNINANWIASELHKRCDQWITAAISARQNLLDIWQLIKQGRNIDRLGIPSYILQYVNSPHIMRNIMRAMKKIL